MQNFNVPSEDEASLRKVLSEITIIISNWMRYEAQKKNHQRI